AVPPLQVDAMVLESVYPTIERATENRLRKYLGPAGRWLVGPLLATMRLQLGVSAKELRPIDHIGAIKCPVLLINGEADANTTREDAEFLYAAGAAPKELWLIPHAGHVDLHLAAKVDYERRVASFFREMIRRH
ncbi:MAG: alpha/beta hydrolase, partial [Chthoniobacterales bacterium]